jgi:arylsulfatase A-like enzyme
LFWRAGKGRAVRHDKWKLVEFGEQHSKLYDLSTDIGEKRDVSARSPEVVKELRAAWNEWSRRMKKPRWPARHREVTVNGEKLVWEL